MSESTDASPRCSQWGRGSVSVRPNARSPFMVLPSPTFCTKNARVHRARGKAVSNWRTRPRSLRFDPALVGPAVVSRGVTRSTTQRVTRSGYHPSVPPKLARGCAPRSLGPTRAKDYFGSRKLRSMPSSAGLDPTETKPSATALSAWCMRGFFNAFSAEARKGAERSYAL